MERKDRDRAKQAKAAAKLEKRAQKNAEGQDGAAPEAGAEGAPTDRPREDG
ncbi:hypothetical protein [Falsiroseomonas sp. CW058]|uniref:hypothetical protein n=1 Tax=Falsiroseomonas sp. CW058 TaxID=3388664 RepID=UPI003D318314